MIEQTIKCDCCDKVIDGDHFEIMATTVLAPTEKNMHTYEAHRLQVHMKCFDLLRAPLQITDNPQKEHQARLEQERVEEEQRLAELAANAPEPPQERQEPQEIATREEK